MRYAIVKGAGTNVHTLSALLIQLKSTLDPEHCENYFYHNSGQPLSQEQMHEITSFLVNLPEQPIIGWNLVGYELRKMSTPTVSLVKLLKESLLDIYYVLQVNFNEMVSFYNITTMETDLGYTHVYHGQTLKLTVAEVPSYLAEGRVNLVENFLVDYCNALDAVWLNWYKGEYMKLSFLTKQGGNSVTLEDWASMFEQHVYHVNAILNLPPHCVVSTLHI